MRTYEVTPSTGTIPLGRQGENYALQVRFPIADWTADYGAGGVFTVLHRRSSDSYSYEVVTAVDGDYLCWDVDRIDTASKGVGRAEVIYSVGGSVAKSVIYVTRVDEAIGDIGTAKYIDVSREGA